MITYAIHKSSMRTEVQKNKHLKQLYTKPLNQLSDLELLMTYTPQITYLSNVKDSVPCTTCSLCMERNKNKE